MGTVVSEKPDKKDSLILTAFSLVSDNYDKMRNCNEIYNVAWQIHCANWARRNTKNQVHTLSFKAWFG